MPNYYFRKVCASIACAILLTQSTNLLAFAGTIKSTDSDARASELIGGAGKSIGQEVEPAKLALAVSVDNSKIAAVPDPSAAGSGEPLRVRATYGSGFPEVDEVNHEILKSEVGLFKLNAEFRTHYTQPNKWRQRRLKIYDLVGGGIANAGDITIMSQFWKYYKNPGLGLAHKGRLESGVITVLCAYLTLGSMYAVEGANDLVTDYKGKRQGFDAKAMRNKAAAAKNEIDSLLEKRQVLLGKIAEITPAQKQYAAAEGKVLQDCRDLGLLELTRLYVDSRKKHAVRDLTTLGTLAVCATGAFPGALNVINGIQDVNLKKIGGGGIGFLISGATLTAAPVLIYGGAAVAGKISSDQLTKRLGELQCKTSAALAQDLSAFDKIAAAAGNGEQGGQAKGYAVLSSLLKDRQDLLELQRKKDKNEIIESFISYAAKGGPQIAWGTMLMRAGYSYTTQPVRAFRAVAQGATANETAWGAWMLDTVQRGVRDEMGNWKYSKNPQDQPFNPANSKLEQLESLVH